VSHALASNDPTDDGNPTLDAQQYLAIDDTIADLLRRHEYTAEEIFSVDARDPLQRAARDLAVAKVRATLAKALYHPTPAHYEAAGRACAWLCHLAMADTATDHLDLQSEGGVA
jgi:hypothetical protein